MSLAARDVSRGRPQLRLVRGDFRPVVNPAEWQRVAQAAVRGQDFQAEVSKGISGRLGDQAARRYNEPSAA